MKGMEVLAPAGSLEIFKSVIDAGADAVYFGGKQFSARAFANNFDFKESKEALNYAHLHGKRAYLTLNTLIKNKEFDDELHKYISFYYENGLDGIIVQDIGLIKYLRDNFPALHVHGSTQLAVCNSYGAKLFQDLGLTRVVPARELSLEEIKKIHNETGLKLEVFVHGALCYCYSGDCLMSSLIGGRSGNRGRCAQPCRLSYDVYDNNKLIKSKGGFVLSLKDLCGVNDLPNLYRSGVSSLKIEGRMKQKQYATNVVNAYRRYVDLLLENEAKGRDEFIVSDKDYNFLLDLGNRCGFTNSYYQGNTDEMVTFIKPSHQSKEIDYEFSENKLEVILDVKAKVGKPFSITAYYNDYSITKQGISIEKASKRPVTLEDIDKRLKKCGATSFAIENINYDIDDNIFIPLGEVGKLRREALQELEDMILSNYKRDEISSKKSLQSINSSELPVNIRNNSKINNLLISITTKEQLKALIKANIPNISPTKFDLGLKITSFDLFKSIDDIKKDLPSANIFVEFPFVIRDKALKLLEDNIDILRKYDGYIVSSYDGLSFVREKELNGCVIAGVHIYSYNNISVDAITMLGANYNIAPLELNHKELAHRNNDNSIITIYGRYPMMISANCINKNCKYCDKKEHNITIKDKKGHSFLVCNMCKVCYNVIYNDLPTCLFEEVDLIKKAGFNKYKLDFVDENMDKTTKILEQFYRCFNNSTSDINSVIHNDNKNEFEFTKGHFKRGVE